MPPIFGILGGMGPLATADFLRKFIESTPARTDQDHIPTLVHNIPQIPDRSASILGDGPSPLPVLLAGVRFLVENGACAIAIPCNTAHHWHRDLQTASPVPILHIVDSVRWALTHSTANADQPTVTQVGLLATTGTLTAGFYQRRLADHGLVCHTPTAEDQADRVMPAIARVKAGQIDEARDLLRGVVERLRAVGAQRLILGCTEIPLALADADPPATPLFLDATAALARHCVDWWTHERPHRIPATLGSTSDTNLFTFRQHKQTPGSDLSSF